MFRKYGDKSNKPHGTILNHTSVLSNVPSHTLLAWASVQSLSQLADLDEFGLPLCSLPNPSPLIDLSVSLLSMYNKLKGRGLVYLTLYPQPFAQCLSHREGQNMFAG